MVESIDCAFVPRRAAQIMRSDMAHLIASESATADELRNLVFFFCAADASSSEPRLVVR